MPEQEDAGNNEASAKSLEEVKRVLTELLGKRFAYESVVVIESMGGPGDKPPRADQPMSSAMAWGFGMVNPVRSHLSCLKMLIEFGKENYDLDTVDPKFLEALFGVKLRPPAGGPGAILHP